MMTIAFLLCFVSCNQGGTQNQTPEHIHNFGEWSVTKNPTYTEDGVKTRYCFCGEKQSDVIPAMDEYENDNTADIITVEDGYLVVNGVKTEHKVYSDPVISVIDGYVAVNGVKTEYVANGIVTEYPVSVDYVIQVLDQYGNPVAGVNIFFAPKGGTSFPMPTDDKGQVAYTTDKEVTIQVLYVPEGYKYDNLAKTQKFGEDGRLNITVTKLENDEPTGTKYVIRVVDQNGEAVVGAKVQMCEAGYSGVCLIPVTTDENGEAIYSVEEGEYKAAITGLPEGYGQLDYEYTFFLDNLATIVVFKTD